jgi:pimeloyl-ACP methyl ester carboxylesterase
MVEVPDAGHVVMVDQPTHIALLILDVLGAASPAQ